MQPELAHLQVWLQPAYQRLCTRREPLALLVAGTMVLVVSGGLSLPGALVATIAFFAWAVLRPQQQTTPDAAGQAELPTDATTSGAGDAIRVRRMLDAIPDAAVLIDGRRRSIAANASARTLFPHTEGLDIAHVNRAPEFLRAVDRAFDTSELQSFDFRTAVPLERNLTGIVAPLMAVSLDPDAAAMVIIVRDRTAERQLAEMRADFVANASHELRTPLASLKGFIETLQGPAKNDPAARERFLAIMQEQAARMTRLIEDLLSLSRIEMHQHVPPSATVDLAEIAASVCRTMEPLAREHGQRMVIELGLEPALTLGDRDELAQVVQNLVQNAIKYGRERGTVAVSIQHIGRRVAVAVADDGIGIAHENLSRLTERFYRVSAKESHERGGTGLGLAIVKHIVSRHGGELKIDSHLGKGSTFTVLLPSKSSEKAE